MNQDNLERILNCDQLPTLPAVALQVIDLTANVNVSMDELAEVIQNDQGLAAKVLKTVNSSFYGLRRPCSTISQSLVMLGLSAVKSLALSFSIVSSIEAKKDGAFDYVAYWRRGLYSGVGAKIVARHARFAGEDEAFLGGLLQDVGMVAMFRALGGEYVGALQEAGSNHRALVRAELARFELQHPDVGAMLAQRWKLPDELIIPVKYHERPTAAPAEHATIVRCVAMGNVAHDVLTDRDPAEAIRRFYARAKEWFDMEASAAEALLKEVGERAREVSSLFRLNTGAAADAEKILEKAARQAEKLTNDPAANSEPAPTIRSLVTDGDDVDPLTGAMTRLAGMKRAEELFETVRGSGKSMSIVGVSVDHLGRLIDTLGSDAGDAAMVEVVALLQDMLATMGATVCRWDSGLLMVLAPNLDRLEAVRTGSEICSAAAAQSKSWLLRSGAPIPLTLSLGIATLECQAASSPFNKVQQLLAAAARAVQAAKDAGGNNVRAFTPRAAAA